MVTSLSKVILQGNIDGQRTVYHVLFTNVNLKILNKRNQVGG